MDAKYLNNLTGNGFDRDCVGWQFGSRLTPILKVLNQHILTLQTEISSLKNKLEIMKQDKNDDDEKNGDCCSKYSDKNYCAICGFEIYIAEPGAIKPIIDNKVSKPVGFVSSVQTSSIQQHSYGLGVFGSFGLPTF